MCEQAMENSIGNMVQQFAGSFGGKQAGASLQQQAGGASATAGGSQATDIPLANQFTQVLPRSLASSHTLLWHAL